MPILPRQEIISWMGYSPRGRWLKPLVDSGRSQKVAVFFSTDALSLADDLRELKDEGYFLVMVSSSAEYGSTTIHQLASQFAVFVDYYDVLADLSTGELTRFNQELTTTLHQDCIAAWTYGCTHPVDFTDSLWVAPSTDSRYVSASNRMQVRLWIGSAALSSTNEGPLSKEQLKDPNPYKLISDFATGPRWAYAWVYGMKVRDASAVTYAFMRLFGRAPSSSDLEVLAQIAERVGHASSRADSRQILKGLGKPLKDVAGFTAGRFPPDALLLAVALMRKVVSKPEAAADLARALRDWASHGTTYGE